MGEILDTIDVIMCAGMGNKSPVNPGNNGDDGMQWYPIFSQWTI
jgi:hypothetical protein